MVKNKINRVIIKATGPQPKASDLEGYTRYDIPWNDGTGENLYIWMKPDGQSQDVFIGSDENLKVVTRSRDIIFKTNTAGVVSSSQAQATLRVIQTNAVYTYRLILSVDHETLTAAGGTAKVSAQLEAKIGDEIVYTKEVNPTITLQESVPGFSLNGSNITVANRTTAIGNPRTCTILATVNAEETGEEVFTTIAVTQEGNYVESISLTKGNFSYAKTVAAGQVVNPTSNGSTPVFTFTSGSTTTVVPSNNYGTVTRSTTYSSRASEGFSAANTETGAVTVASRGTTIGNARTSNEVTRHESYSFVPSSSYNTKGQVDSELDSQATVTQAENVPVSVSVTPDFTYPSGEIPASGGNKTPDMSNNVIVTWSSGETSIADETGESGYTLNVNPNWDMIAADGFTIDSSTGTVTAENRGTTEGDSYTSGDITLTSEVTISISEEYGGGSVSDEQEITKDDPVTQAPNHRIQVFSKPTITKFTVADIPAKGGTVNSGTVTYHQASTWYYDSGETTEGPSYTEGGSVQFGSAITAASLGTTVKSRSVVGTLTCTVSMNGQTSVEGDAVVYQQANDITSYGNVTISGGTVADIPAKGGTISSMSGISASQTITYTSEATRAGDVDISYSTAVSASSLNTTVKARTKVGTLTATATGEGSKSASKAADVYQAANSATYGNVSLTANNPSAVASTGGTATISASASQTVSFTSGSSRAGSVSIAYKEKSAVSGFTLNGNKVTVGANSSTSSRSYVVVVTATGESSKTASKEVTISQIAGTQTFSEITLNVTYPVISAAGGTVTPTVSYSQTWGWNGSTTGGGTITSGGTLTYSGTSVSTSNGAVTAGTKGATESGVTNVTTATVKVTLNGKTAQKQVTVQQAANTATYGNVTISGGSVSTIPASGGSVSSASGISASQTVSFTSGATRAGSVNITYSSAVSASSKGTTISNQTTVGTLTATATGEGSKKATKQFTVYQAKNVPVSIYSNASFSYPTGAIPAAGGTKSPTLTGAVGITWSSGSEQSLSSAGSYTGFSLAASRSYSMVAATGFSINTSTGVITATNRDTTEGAARSCGNVSSTLDWTLTIDSTYGGGTLEASDTDILTTPVSQQANTRSDAGITYGTWQASVSADKYTTSSSPCPAGGGTCTITASATRTRTRNYSYTSGSTSTEALSNEAGSPTLSISGTGASLSGTTVTWANRGTEIGEVRQATVTATIDSKKAEVVVYQQANSYEDTYLSPIINTPRPSHNFSKDGGTWASGVTVSQNGTRTYTSGSTSPITGSASFSFYENVDWLSTSGGNITATANTTSSSRSATVTINGTGSGGATSRSSLSITQDAGTYLNVSPTSLSFTASGGSKTLTIDTNESWTIS